MPQIIACEWRVIFSENLLHKTVYPLKDPWFKDIYISYNYALVLCKGILHLKQSVYVCTDTDCHCKICDKILFRYEKVLFTTV